MIASRAAVRRAFYALTAVAALNVAGCATIIGDRNQMVGISSAPEQASITVMDERGQQVFAGQTPASVLLAKSDGSYFGGKTYRVRFEKPGYKQHEIVIETQANGWYIGGNLLFGGLIGWLVVDPITGAMYDLAPGNVVVNLESSVTPEENAGSLSLILLEELPRAMRGELRQKTGGTVGPAWYSRVHAHTRQATRNSP